MDKRQIFGEDVQNYDRWRPRYCPELFQDIIEYANISNTCKIIEIGCGTGQATQPFLEKGYQLLAVELSEKMSAFVKNKYKQYEKFSILNLDFEGCTIKSASVDLAFSATAFHWIDEEIGYTKLLRILKPGGSIALFWNRPYVARKDDMLHQKIQEIYKKYEEKGYRAKRKIAVEHNVKRYNEICDTIRHYGFINVQCKLYHRTRCLNAEEYICLLNTYSDHRQMEKEAKEKFEEEIAKAINVFGGILNIYDTVDLYLAQKPENRR